MSIRAWPGRSGWQLFVVAMVVVTVLPFCAKPDAVALPDGFVVQPYEARVPSASDAGGAWTLTAGTLPEGLRLVASGTILGTPTKAGGFRVHGRVEGHVDREG